jgi:hypothetical protein
MDGRSHPHPRPGRLPCLPVPAVREPWAPPALPQTSAKPPRGARAVSHAWRRGRAHAGWLSSPWAPGVPPPRRGRPGRRRGRPGMRRGRELQQRFLPACPSVRGRCSRPGSVKPGPQAPLETQAALLGSGPPCPRGRTRTAPAWGGQPVCLLSGLARAGGRRTPAPPSTRGGPRHTGAWGMARCPRAQPRAALSRPRGRLRPHRGCGALGSRVFSHPSRGPSGAHQGVLWPAPPSAAHL